MKERIRSTRVADITSLSTRQIQYMAAHGQIPGAAKLGSAWTFDEAKLRRWIGEKEEEAARPVSAWRPDINEAYERALWGGSVKARRTRETRELLAKSREASKRRS